MPLDQVIRECEHCGVVMSNFDEVFQHLYNRDPNHIGFIRRSESSKDRNQWYCWECKGWLGRGHKGFGSHDAMWAHLKKCHLHSLNQALWDGKAESLSALQETELLTQTLLVEGCKRPVAKSKE